MTDADRARLGTVLELDDIAGFSVLQTVTELRDLLAAMEHGDVGCTVMPENIDDADPADRTDLVAMIDHPALIVSLDTGHAELAHGRHGAPPGVDCVAASGGRIGHVHLLAADGCADRHWHLGEGRILWAPVFAALAEAAPEARSILEVKEGARRHLMPACMKLWMNWRCSSTNTAKSGTTVISVPAVSAVKLIPVSGLRRGCGPTAAPLRFHRRRSEFRADRRTRHWEGVATVLGGPAVEHHRAGRSASSLLLMSSTRSSRRRRRQGEARLRTPHAPGSRDRRRPRMGGSHRISSTTHGQHSGDGGRRNEGKISLKLCGAAIPLSFV